jgi:3D (Asp-Asp-Asp) domain-containing protein
MEFGTAIYIPMFENVFYCTDRGSAITEGKIDIYMVDINRALEFGRRYVEVFVLP